MKADITRDTFNQLKHYSRVMMQQGRVQLDADWNEQASILLHYMRTVVQDIVGPYATPAGHAGFRLAIDANTKKGDFDITSGRIYVKGILVENDEAGATYLNQPYYRNPPTLQQNKNYGVYLDVWERHVTSLLDPNIREVALGGPDTATRTQVVWQVKTWPAESGASGELCETLAQDLGASLDNIKKYRTQLENPVASADGERIRGEIAHLRSKIDDIRNKLAGCEGDAWCLTVQGLPSTSDAGLKARVEPTEPSKDPCIQAPASLYRGAVNQLYRVEIHAWTGQTIALLHSNGRGTMAHWRRPRWEFRDRSSRCRARAVLRPMGGLKSLIPIRTCY
jgi:hypothetical protein